MTWLVSRALERLGEFLKSIVDFFTYSTYYVCVAIPIFLNGSMPLRGYGYITDDHKLYSSFASLLTASLVPCTNVLPALETGPRRGNLTSTRPRFNC